MDDTLYWSRGCLAEKNEQGELFCKCKESCHKLTVFDWLQNLPAAVANDIVEIRFKNTRKGFFRNLGDLMLRKGDIVAVEASPGHDIGIVSLTGPLVFLQMRKYNINPECYEFKKVYRKVKATDVEKWQEAIALEQSTMIESRKIAADLKLNMKIGDVEYQGDKTKAIFYYIADERVDFRELIKVLAERFRIRVEMRQIGARQEAGLIGGIGPCGRELCCAKWMHNFVSVSTNSARYQEISLNPQKLAGQCSKLKCCLNFELDSYLDARRSFPQINGPIETEKGRFFLQKTDVLKGLMWFSCDSETQINLTPVPVARVRELVEMCRRNIPISDLLPESGKESSKHPFANSDFKSAAGEGNITRFDNNNKPRKKRHKPKRRPNNDNPNPPASK